jgi:hypothetical protein
MTVTVKVLHQGVQVALAPAETTVYTAPASTRTIIDKLTVLNIGAAPAVIALYIVPSGLTTDPVYGVAKKTIAVDETYTFPEIVGHILAPGDFIIATSSTNFTGLRASGREVT